MALVDDILSGNWVTGLAIGVGAVIVLPLAAPVLRPLAKAAIKSGILAYQGAAGLVEGIGDLVADIAAEDGEEVAEEGDCAAPGERVGIGEAWSFVSLSAKPVSLASGSSSALLLWTPARRRERQLI